MSLAHELLPADNQRYTHQQASKNPNNSTPILSKRTVLTEIRETLVDSDHKAITSEFTTDETKNKNPIQKP